MRLLLDTHIFLWYISGDKRLPPVFQKEIGFQTNEVYLSVVSLWEIEVKYQLGKLPLPHSPEYYIPVQRKRHRISSINLTEKDVAKLLLLPPIHRDPFDRMLVCQALAQGLKMMTLDETVRQYPIEFV